MSRSSPPTLTRSTSQHALDAVDDTGISALMDACLRGDVTLASWLLSAGAEISLQCDGCTAMDVVKIFRPGDMALLGLLSSYGGKATGSNEQHDRMRMKQKRKEEERSKKRISLTQQQQQAAASLSATSSLVDAIDSSFLITGESSSLTLDGARTLSMLTAGDDELDAAAHDMFSPLRTTSVLTQRLQDPGLNGGNLRPPPASSGLVVREYFAHDSTTSSSSAASPFGSPSPVAPVVNGIRSQPSTPPRRPPTTPAAPIMTPPPSSSKRNAAQTSSAQRSNRSQRDPIMLSSSLSHQGSLSSSSFCAPSSSPDSADRISATPSPLRASRNSFSHTSNPWKMQFGAIPIRPASSASMNSTQTERSGSSLISSTPPFQSTSFSLPRSRGISDSSHLPPQQQSRGHHAQHHATSTAASFSSSSLLQSRLDGPLQHHSAADDFFTQSVSDTPSKLRSAPSHLPPTSNMSRESSRATSANMLTYPSVSPTLSGSYSQELADFTQLRLDMPQTPSLTSSQTQSTHLTEYNNPLSPVSPLSLEILLRQHSETNSRNMADSPGQTPNALPTAASFVGHFNHIGPGLGGGLGQTHARILSKSNSAASISSPTAALSRSISSTSVSSAPSSLASSRVIEQEVMSVADVMASMLQASSERGVDLSLRNTFLLTIPYFAQEPRDIWTIMNAVVDELFLPFNQGVASLSPPSSSIPSAVFSSTTTDPARSSVGLAQPAPRRISSNSSLMMGGGGGSGTQSTPNSNPTSPGPSSEFTPPTSPPPGTTFTTWLASKLRTFSVLKYWIKTYPQDFLTQVSTPGSPTNSTQELRHLLMARFQSFPPVSFVPGPHLAGLSKLAASTLKSLAELSLHGCKTLRPQLLTAIRLLSAVERVHQWDHIRQPGSSFLDLSVETLAQTIHAWTIHRFQDISSPRELLRHARTMNQANGESEDVNNDLIGRNQMKISNVVSLWVCTEFLCAGVSASQLVSGSLTDTSLQSTRLKVFKKFFACAVLLLRVYGNFNAAFELLIGLAMQPAHRLVTKQIESALSDAEKRAMKRMMETMHSAENYRLYRALYQGPTNHATSDANAINIPITSFVWPEIHSLLNSAQELPEIRVPYLGVVCKDLVALEEGQPPLVTSSDSDTTNTTTSSSVLETQLHVTKCRTLSNLLFDALTCQTLTTSSSDLPLARQDHLNQFTQALSLTCSEAELTVISERIQPRLTRSTSNSARTSLTPVAPAGVTPLRKSVGGQPTVSAVTPPLSSASIPLPHPRSRPSSTGTAPDSTSSSSSNSFSSTSAVSSSSASATFSHPITPPPHTSVHTILVDSNLTPVVAVPQARLVGIELNPGPISPSRRSSSQAELVEPPTTKAKLTQTHPSVNDLNQAPPPSIGAVGSKSPSSMLYRDALHTIFTFLDLHDLVCTCLVNQFWYNAACTMKSRQDEFNYHRPLSFLIESPLRYHITHLNLYSQKLELRMLSVLSERMAHLNSLQIRIKFIQPGDLPTIPSDSSLVWFPIPPHLHELCIQFHFWPDCNLEADAPPRAFLSACLQQIGVQATGLLNFKLSGDYSWIGAIECPRELLTLSSVTDLTLPYQFTQNSQIDLIKMMPSIRRWSPGKEVTREHIQRLVDGSPTTHLEHINGYFGEVDETMAYELRKVRTLTQLSFELSLSDPTQLLPHFPRLSILALSCNYDTVDCNLLTTALATCISLTELTIDHRKLTSDHLTRFLPQLTSLLTLALLNCVDLVSLSFLTTSHLGRLSYFEIEGSQCIPLNEYHLHLRSIASTLEYLIITDSSAEPFQYEMIAQWTPRSKKFQRHEWPHLIEFRFTQCPHRFSSSSD